MPDTQDSCDVTIAEYTIGQTCTPQLLEEVRAQANGAPVRVTASRENVDNRARPG